MNPALSLILSPFWSTTNALARALGGRGGARLPVPVISVGNIVAGGVGKTELAACIAQRLLAEGKRVTVAMRGYASEWEHRSAVGLDYESAASLRFPDEALVVLKKCPGVAVAVGRRRARTLQRYWEELRPDVVILDDGFQHFKMARDLDVLVHSFDLKSPLLRDFPFWLSKAGLRVAFSDVPAVWKKRPWVRAEYHLNAARSASGLPVSLPSKANLFCGIGNPARLRAFLEKQGVVVNAMKAFSDHHAYDQKNVEWLRSWNRKNGGLPLLTTLKDWVKLSAHAECAGFEPLWLDISVAFLENESLFWRVIGETLASPPHPRPAEPFGAGR